MDPSEVNVTLERRENGTRFMMRFNIFYSMSDVKRKVQNATDIAISRQRLFFKEKLLRDQDSVVGSGIRRDDSIVGLEVASLPSPLLEPPPLPVPVPLRAPPLLSLPSSSSLRPRQPLLLSLPSSSSSRPLQSPLLSLPSSFLSLPSSRPREPPLLSLPSTLLSLPPPLSSSSPPQPQLLLPPPSSSSPLLPQPSPDRIIVKVILCPGNETKPRAFFVEVDVNDTIKMLKEMIHKRKRSIRVEAMRLHHERTEMRLADERTMREYEISYAFAVKVYYGEIQLLVKVDTRDKYLRPVVHLDDTVRLLKEKINAKFAFALPEHMSGILLETSDGTCVNFLDDQVLRDLAISHMSRIQVNMDR